MHRFLRPAMAIAAVAVCSAPALAAVTSTTSKSMTVTANVVPSCTLDSVPTILLDKMTFGTTDATAQITGSINVTCTNGTKYDINIADSASAVGGKRFLTLSGGTATLGYDLYTTGGTTAYPVAAGTAPSMFTGSGNSDPNDVVLKLASGALTTAPAGSYTDSVDVTVSY